MTQQSQKATPAQPAKNTSTDPELENEGEGSRSGARRYDTGAERAASDPARVAELAKKAKEALASPEGASLREAEQRGKKANHR